MTLSLAHDCMVRTHHLPLPYVYREYHTIPVAWQLQVYGEVRIPDTVTLCPTHDTHAHLAREAAVANIVFGADTPFTRRQFGRELWGLAEDAALWLRERRHMLPDGFEWHTLPSELVVPSGINLTGQGASQTS